MTLGAGRVRALLDEHGIVPSRALGQNFLVDPNTARRLAAAVGIVPGDRVLEIGPGLGSLTLAVAELGAPVVAVELDRRVAGVLDTVLSEDTRPGQVELIVADALTADLRSLLAPDVRWRLAANLPYNVGTTILLRVLAEVPQVSGGMVLVQREVAERLAARPRDPAYGIPSVKAAWWAEIVVAGRVPATVFHPRPRVDSAFCVLERRPPPADEALRAPVFALIEAGFGQRRKMLRRSLATLATPEDLDAVGIDATARAEELALADWVRLATRLAA